MSDTDFISAIFHFRMGLVLSGYLNLFGMLDTATLTWNLIKKHSNIHAMRSGSQDDSK